ncbi:MAG TPA: CHAT domain-containing protein [Xanthobacteraceae bacterium]|nr:CHAT domain-containing protein [Xanthobacteraceae bacterium]
MAKRAYLIVAFVAWLFALIMAAPAAAEQAETAATVKRKAFELYQHGRVLQAARMEEAASRAATDAGDRVSLEVDAVDMCATAGDWDCVAQGVDAALRVVAANSQLDLYRPRLLASWLRLQVWRADDAAIARFLHDPYAQTLVDSIRNPIDLAMVELALHDWYARKNDVTAAEHSLDLVRTALLRMDGRYSTYDKARVLVGLIQSLRFSNDVSGATALAMRVDAYIAKSLPHDSAEYAQYVFERAELSSYWGHYETTGPAFREAIAAIERLDISDREKAYRLAIANGMASAAFAFNGKLDEARAVLARHPLQAQKQAILARGSFANMAEFYFAVSDVFVGIDARRAPDLRWKPIFDKHVGWNIDPAARRQLGAFRDYTRAKLATWSGQRADAVRFLKLAAHQWLDEYNAALRAGFEEFPLPNLLDMLIAGAGLDAAALADDADGVELMLEGSELQQRTLRHALVDAAVLLDSQEDPAARRDAKAYLELVRRKRAWEIDRIGASLESSATADSAELVRQYTRAVTDITALKDRLRRNPRLMPTSGLPTVAELQRALAPEDAYVAYYLSVSGLGKLCITPHGVFHSSAPFPSSFVADVKLLEFATAASYPANPTLDAQYPVSSALNVEQFLFGGLEACLRPGTHVIVMMPEWLSSVPLGALLDAPPPRAAEGYDLAKAHWMIRDLSFSQVLSARQYLATVRYLHRAPAPRAYLAVGDPKLDQARLAQLASTSAFRGVGAVTGLTGLPELPETAEELKAVAALVHAPASDVLLHEAATEQALRSRPLDEYDVLHVATHGLLAADLAGLTEPALVLTPVNPDDASNDGLLTSSEIAQLPLNARLVVLSACNTAKPGIAIVSSGMQDLQTAFTVAGASTVLASLWPIDSPTARDITVRFFAEWRSPQGAGAAEALARATRAYLAAADAPHQHPRFWAPFVVLGNGDVRGAPGEAAATPSAAMAAPATGELIPASGR